MAMNIYDYVLKRKIGYFAVRYLKYLEENYPEAYERFLDRADCREILQVIQDHCQLDMQNLMEMLNGKDGHLNYHDKRNADPEYLPGILYRYLVSGAKDYVFESCWELMKYAEWMRQSNN